MTLKPPEETFVNSTRELTELWRDLMGTDGFGRRTLWMIFLAANGELCPCVVPIEDLPAEPDERLLGNLANIVRSLLEDGLRSVAFLLSRPGPSQMDDTDRGWARELTRALPRDLRRWPIHLATHGHVQVFALDDLIAA